MVEFYVPISHGEAMSGETVCPECDKRMAVYTPRGYADELMTVEYLRPDDAS